MAKPKNIVLIIADSLRYDSVYHNGKCNLPYTESNAIQFEQARSAGCWTLPAIASMFTNLMPHEHGATSQSRNLRKDIPTLAERLRDEGYDTHLLTANKVVTDIFGLDRGFNNTYRVWNNIKPKLNRLMRLLAIVGKPRVRNILFSKDKFLYQLSDEITAGTCWVQNTYMDIFNRAKKIMKKQEKKDKGSFIFINLMETHFPYHVAPTFKLTSKKIKNKLREAVGLYNLLNQSFLINDKYKLQPDLLNKLKQRQYLSWDLLSKGLDSFIKEIHEEKDNLIIFTSDHGDNFGEQNWSYHFSNVTDAGNRVPLFWLDHENRTPQTRKTPVSSRFIHNSILDSCDLPHSGETLFGDELKTFPIMQSYWYDNQGKTLDKYKYNQFCFLNGEQRYLFKNDRWFTAPVTNNGKEHSFEAVDEGINPIKDFVEDRERKQYLEKTFSKYRLFSETLI